MQIERVFLKLFVLGLLVHVGSSIEPGESLRSRNVAIDGEAIVIAAVEEERERKKAGAESPSLGPAPLPPQILRAETVDNDDSQSVEISEASLTKSDSGKAEGDSSGLSDSHKRGLTIGLAVLLALLSAIFAGLTLGLMTLDVVQLKIMMDAAGNFSATTPGSKGASFDEAHRNKVLRDARRAKRIYRLRRDGNFLLVTLLICNVASNSAFSIITSDLTSGLIGFFISTSIITLFGEIVPQAVFTRYSLVVGYYLAPLVLVCEILLYIIVKPIALCLDLGLGRDLGTNYNREQLKALLGHHQREIKVLRRDEAQILFGGLDVASKAAASAMTPVERVYGISINGILDFDTAAGMIVSGYSRVPVLDRSLAQCVVGLLYTKDIALLDPSLKLPIRLVLSMFGRPVYGVDVDTDLLSILTEFKKGQSHMAIVREVVSDGMRDPYYKHVGIITLEDVIEEILQDEIIDEYENPQAAVPLETREGQPIEATPQPKKLSWDCLRLHCFRKQRDSLMQKSFIAPPLPENQTGLLQGASGVSTASIQTTPKRQPASSAWQLLTEGVRAPRGLTASARQQFPKQQEERVRLPSWDATKPLPQNARSGVATSSPGVVAGAQTPQSLGVASTATAVLSGQASQSRDRQATGASLVELTRQRRRSSSNSSIGLEGLRQEDGPRPKASPTVNSTLTNAMMGRLRLFDQRRRVEPLSNNECTAVGLFLSASETAFRNPYLTSSGLQRLLRACPIIQSTSDVTHPLYERGVKADSFILILQGAVRVSVGNDNVECDLGPWHSLGVKALGPPNLNQIKNELQSSDGGSGVRDSIAIELDRRLSLWSSTYSYIPDFSAVPLEKAAAFHSITKEVHVGGTLQAMKIPALRYLRITRTLYLQALKGESNTIFF